MNIAWEIIAAYVRGDLTYAEAQEQLRFVEAPSEMFLALQMEKQSCS